MSRNRTLLALLVAVLVLLCPAAAGPWTDVGDAQLRSDVEIAAAAGLLDNVTMQWPLPWTGVLGLLRDERRIDAMPEYVRDAAERLRALGKADLGLYRAHATLSVDVASDPAVVRGYDALGRAEQQVQLSYEHLWSNTALHISLGTQHNNRNDRQRLVFDGTYIAQRLDGMVFYAGYVPHWWGPGWISSLSLSTNARPMPQIGLSRIRTAPSEIWLLRWLGPWQFEGFVGVLDGQRQDTNTVYVAARFAFNPVPGLEIGLSRTTEMCGKNHSCSPLRDYFTFSNDPNNVNNTNDQGSIDLRYTGTIMTRAFAVYAQFMNEDSNPFVNSSTSRLFGGSLWLSAQGLTGRLTLEYANSLATHNIWGGGIQHGIAYNNGGYPDGMRYRDRSLGFSLDSDSVLYSLQASVTDRQRWIYTLTYHRALVSHPLNTVGNAVTTSPVRFNAIEAKVGIPLQWNEYRARIDASARWQDDRPRPLHGAEAAFEVAMRFGI